MSCILKSINANLTKVGLRPLHPCNIAFYYIPMKGCVCYTLLSTQMLNPEVYENFRFLIIPRYLSLTNACLVNSLLGSSLYLFSRQHLLSTPPKIRVAYSVFGASVFNLGSLLLWALGRTVLPNCTSVRFIVGVSSAVGMLWVAKSYLQVIDEQIPPRKIHSE